MNSKTQNAPLSVLLADDDIDDRLFFHKALSGIPISSHLTTVHDGEQLMSYLFEHIGTLPAILFLDLSMPLKNGFERQVGEISENEKLKNLPVVVFTTSSRQNICFEQSLINTLFKFGAQEYVRKPTDVADLQEIIHRALVLVMETVSSNDAVMNL